MTLETGLRGEEPSDEPVDDVQTQVVGWVKQRLDAMSQISVATILQLGADHRVSRLLLDDERVILAVVDTDFEPEAYAYLCLRQAFRERFAFHTLRTSTLVSQGSTRYDIIVAMGNFLDRATVLALLHHKGTLVSVERLGHGNKLVSCCSKRL